MLVLVSSANTASLPRIAFAHLWENHKNMSESPTKLSSQGPGKLQITALITPHWKALTLAFIAVLGETFSDVLEPWPIKIVIDNILQSKALPGWIGRLVSETFGHDKVAILNFAVAAVAIIAVVGAISSYIEKYLTTSVSQWVPNNLRRTLYT